MSAGQRTGPDDVLIVGGGIGGLATALTLARSGRHVRVLERSAEFGEIGAGLQLAPNATRVLGRLGLLEQVIDLGVLPRRLVCHNALTGQELTSLELGDDFRQRFGGPYLVMHRSDLLDILLTACRAEPRAVLESGKDVTTIQDSVNQVQVGCADGTSAAAAALIGADGLRSTVRRLLSDDEPICSGYVAYRGAVPTERAARLASLDDVVLWIGPGLHFVQYPLRRGELYNQVAVFRSDEYTEGHEDWGGPEELDRAFSVTCPQVREALPSLGRDRRWPMFDREPITEWTAGRVALLGDAAHPMLQYLAQGACQALEDAAAIGHAFDRHVGSTPTLDTVQKAFCAYQEARSSQAARVQRTARLWGDIWHVDGVAMLLRDELFIQRAIDDYRYIDWLYGEAPPG